MLLYTHWSGESEAGDRGPRRDRIAMGPEVRRRQRASAEGPGQRHTLETFRGHFRGTYRIGTGGGVQIDAMVSGLVVC